MSKNLDILLSKISKRDNLPQATKALHLLEFALEIEEDVVFDKIASERDKKGVRFLKHKQAWT